MKNTMKRGFTLIELLIVIAIIGLLATIAIVSLSSAQQKARDAKRIADVKQLQSAVELHFSEMRYYPEADTWTELQEDLDDFLTQIPTDPNNDDAYYYVYASDAAEGAGAATQYVLGTRIEVAADAGTALDGDVDGVIAINTGDWGATMTRAISTSETPAANSQAVTANTVNCADTGTGDDGFYCLTN